MGLSTQLWAVSFQQSRQPIHPPSLPALSAAPPTVAPRTAQGWIWQPSGTWVPWHELRSPTTLPHQRRSHALATHLQRRPGWTQDTTQTTGVTTPVGLNSNPGSAPRGKVWQPRPHNHPTRPPGVPKGMSSEPRLRLHLPRQGVSPITPSRPHAAVLPMTSAGSRGQWTPLRPPATFQSHFRRQQGSRPPQA